ncbi:MAG: hypothetical protein ONB05_05935 [candidate division KSB1 bacterium]|nr:hypothetical protein [candidate division KSB1 bacterium]
MAKKLVRASIIFSLLFMVFFQGGDFCNSQDVIISQNLIPTVTITGSDLINFILEQCLITETNVTKMEILDINRNGFGEKDIIKTYPSNQLYLMERISEEVQEVMDNWQFQANFQITGINKPPSVYDSLKTNRAANAIFSSLLRGINQNYHDYPIKIHFERDSTGVTFEMWGYDQTKLERGYPRPFVPDSVITFDIFHVFHEDTLVNVDTTLYDLLYIYRTSVDTVIVGPYPKKVTGLKE